MRVDEVGQENRQAEVSKMPVTWAGGEKELDARRASRAPLPGVPGTLLAHYSPKPSTMIGSFL